MAQRSPDGKSDQAAPYGGRFAAAVAVARKGRYAEASRLVQAALEAEECSEADAFDLQARMCAQQGLYLQAESFWQRAKAVGGLNPIYDDGLARLRKGRGSPERWLNLAMAGVAVVALGFLVWQAAYINPQIAGRLEGTGALVAFVREDLARADLASQERHQNLSFSNAARDGYLRDINSRIAEQLEMLTTASKAARERESAITHLDEQVTALQTRLNERLDILSASHTEAAVAQIEGLDAALSDIEAAVKSMEQVLLTQIKASETGLAERIEQIEASFRRDVALLPTSAEFERLEKRIAALKAELNDFPAQSKR